MKGREHDIEYLVGQAETLQASFERLFTPRDWEEIIEIWRKPGWTTPAEFFLVSASLDTMVSLTESLVEMKGALLEGSQLVEVRG